MAEILVNVNAQILGLLKMLSKIRENLYIGSREDAENSKDLKEKGITSILNVAYELKRPARYVDIFPDLTWVQVSLDDDFGNKPYMKELAVHSLKTMLYNKETVMIHCSAGMSRSVYILVKALADIESKDISLIFDEVQRLHFIATRGPLFKME